MIDTRYNLQSPRRIDLVPQAVDLILGAEEISVPGALAESVGFDASMARPSAASLPAESSPTAVLLAALAVVLQPRVNWRVEERFDALRGERLMRG